MRSGNPRAGQSIIEVLVATAVGSIMVIAAVSLISPALRGNRDVANIQMGSAIAKEAIDQVRAWGEADWHNLSNLSTSSANTYFLVPSSPFAVTSGTESVLPVPATNLIGYWKFDEASSTTGYDFSTTNATGTVGANVSRASSSFGLSLNFPGTGSPTFSVPDNNTFDFGTSSFSVAMWGYYRDFTNPKAWFMLKKSGTCYLGSSPGWDIGHGYTATGIRICYTDGTNLVTNATVTFDTGFQPTDLMNQWVHLVVVFDKSANSVKFYVNGKKQTNEYNIAAVTGSVNNSSSLTMGSMYGWQTDAKMDELRVYNGALSADDVFDLYRATPFFRNFYLDAVNRDGSDNIAAGAGTYDPSTLKLTVNYNWIGGTTSTMVSYLTRAGNRFYQQTDWSRSGGVDGPATSTGNGYATSTNIATSSGSFQVYIP
jgi:Tfp pilus assembly protein PilV